MSYLCLSRITLEGKKILAQVDCREYRLEEHRFSPGVDTGDQHHRTVQLDRDRYRIINRRMREVCQLDALLFAREDKLIVIGSRKTHSRLIVVKTVILFVDIA